MEFLSYWRQEIRETCSNNNIEKSIIYCFLAVKLSFLNLSGLNALFVEFEWFSYCFSGIAGRIDRFQFIAPLLLCVVVVAC